jgi:hypothetical protein
MTHFEMTIEIGFEKLVDAEGSDDKPVADRVNVLVGHMINPSGCVGGTT